MECGMDCFYFILIDIHWIAYIDDLMMFLWFDIIHVIHSISTPTKCPSVGYNLMLSDYLLIFGIHLIIHITDSITTHLT